METQLSLSHSWLRLNWSLWNENLVSSPKAYTSHEHKRFQFRQAVVQQSRRENIVAYLLLWSAIQRLAGARSRRYHVRLLLSKQHVSAFFKMYRLRFLLRGSLLCSLLVFHSAFLAFLLACLFCFFPFVSISAPFVFCSVFLVVHYVSWRFLALRGLSWLALAFPGFSWLCLAFLFSCLCFFAGFLVYSVSWPFDIDTRLCKALCPHPGEVFYLTYLFFFWFLLSDLLSCLFLAFLGVIMAFSWLFLACLVFYWLVLSSLVFSWFFLAFLLSYLSLLGVCLPSCRCPPSLRLIDSLIRQAICCLIILSINVSNGPTNPHLRQLIS